MKDVLMLKSGLLVDILHVWIRFQKKWIGSATLTGTYYRYTVYQGCGSGFAIRIQYADPKPDSVGKSYKIKTGNMRGSWYYRVPVTTLILFKCYSKFAQAPIFLLLSNLLCFLSTTEKKSLHKVILSADPDSHLKSSWIRIRIEENCCIRIRKKWLRIHSPAVYITCLALICNVPDCEDLREGFRDTCHHGHWCAGSRDWHHRKHRYR